MDSIVGSNFKITFAKFRTYGSREQCTGLEKMQMQTQKK